MSKLVWRVKLVAELQAGVTTETEVARIERGAEAGLADLGLRLDEAKQLTAALQAEMVSAQVAVVGKRRRGCMARVSGTGAGQAVGASSLPCAAGRSASPCVTWPASAASSDTSPICWATSHVTGMRWCPTRPEGGAES